MNSTTSCGLTAPREAWPRVRISTMVITMVISTTSVAPKLCANSLRIEDWNNIDWVNAFVCFICCKLADLPNPELWTLNSKH